MRLTQCDQTWPETLKNENCLEAKLDSIVGFSDLLCRTPFGELPWVAVWRCVNIRRTLRLGILQEENSVVGAFPKTQRNRLGLIANPSPVTYHLLCHG